MMYGWYGGYGWIGMIVSLLFWVMVIGGFVWLIIWAASRVGRGSNTSHLSVGLSSKEIAQQRYAHGEITREQYQQLLEDLKR